MRPLVATALFCGLSGLGTACSMLPPQLQGLGEKAFGALANAPSVNDAEEERLAQQSATRFESENRLWNDPRLESYVSSVAQRIAAKANPRPFSYRVRIVNATELNAFTFGGGLLYLNAGLLARLENEAQLAFVLGHEIAHVTERHIPKGIETAYNAAAFGKLARDAVANKGWVAPEAVDAFYPHALGFVVHGHGRGLESEADRLGLDYMLRAGYDPRQAEGALQQLLREFGDPPALENAFYGDHPATTTRLEHVRELLAKDHAGVISCEPLAVVRQEYAHNTRQIALAVGKLDRERGRLRTAVALFERAVEGDANDPRARYELGRVLFEIGGQAELTAAVEHLSEAVRLAPRYAAAHRELGLALLRSGNGESAGAEFGTYLDLATDAPDRQRVQDYIDEIVRRTK